MNLIINTITKEWHISILETLGKDEKIIKNFDLTNEIKENSHNYKVNDTLDNLVLDQDKINLEQNEKRKNEIYEELEAIDKKSIRAIRESNQDLINQYENEAQLLRTELQGLI